MDTQKDSWLDPPSRLAARADRRGQCLSEFLDGELQKAPLEAVVGAHAADLLLISQILAGRLIQDLNRPDPPMDPYETALSVESCVKVSRLAAVYLKLSESYAKSAAPDVIAVPLKALGDPCDSPADD